MAHSSLTLLFLSCILLAFALTCQAQEEVKSRILEEVDLEAQLLI